jgi:hypothetical protein
MRIERIELSWFRGAAETGQLKANSRNVVVYGANASGKSTFVDGVEYIVRNGKICHLQHEYSGSYEEKGVRNTHTPCDTMSQSAIYFDDGSSVIAKIKPDGSLAVSSIPKDLKSTIQSWNFESHLLRQDEVSRFIHYTKGEKYSALLQLLGLGSLEQAAENLRLLGLQITRQSGIETARVQYKQLVEAAEKHLKSLKVKDALKQLNEVANRYSVRKRAEEIEPLAKQIMGEIEKRIKTLEPDQHRYLVVEQILSEELEPKSQSLISAETEAERKVDALLDIRISILEPMAEFTGFIEDPAKKIQCPSCGQLVLGTELIDHVTKELEMLREARAARDKARNSRKELATALKSAQKTASDSTFQSWLKSSERKELSDLLERLIKTRIPDAEVRWKTDEAIALEHLLSDLIPLLEEEAKQMPPSTEGLINDRDFVNTCLTLPEINRLETDIVRVQAVIETLQKSEDSVREEIKRRAERILGNISTDVRQLWSKLHPDEPIEDIKLYAHSDVDKAIDIGLKFFGTDQPSPRLTLSEGYRNSLGLCIFLALARFEGGNDPIILDDIVSSLDREHRGMLAELILNDLPGRQVILFTHDREWYSELHYRFPATNWSFMVLRPWENPGIGLRWSESAYTFDDAKALLPSHPEACGNRSRAIMDTQLSIAAEKLKIPMHYLRGERNDHRTCVDFLSRIIGEAPKRLKRKSGDTWSPYEVPISDWNTAKGLLIAWGDRASHGGSLTAQEAKDLIEACEKVMAHFRCKSCGNYIWIADQSGRKCVQCTCGELHWSYE